MDRNFVKTRFSGVYYRLVKTDDRLYYVNYADVFGVRHWKCVGSHRDGMRPNTPTISEPDDISTGPRHFGRTEEAFRSV